MDANVIEAIPVPAVLIGPDDLIDAGNRRFLDLFPQAQFERPFQRTLRQPELAVVLGMARSGKQATGRITVAGGRVFDVTCAMVDSGTALVCLQNESETEAAAQMRRDFVADMTHELRSPLTAVRGMLDTVGADPGALAHFQPMLVRELDRMNALVGDLLVLTRVESNQLRRPKDSVDMPALIGSAIESVALKADKAGVSIQSHLPPDPVTIPGDSDELHRALTNLLENAIRYGGSGGVIDVTLMSASAGLLPSEQAIKLIVRDHGDGVEPYHLPRLTERFYRVDAHRARDAGGTGLGLAIVKHVVTRHRGRMALDSKPGQGLEVRLKFPAR